MVVAIIDTLTTIAEVCGIQGHNMNTLATAGAVRIFSDDIISYNINNVIRFVYGASLEDLNQYLQLFCVNTISVIALNNVMFEAGYLQDKWEYVDPFNKENFYKMITKFKADINDPIDVIYTMRGQFNQIEDAL